MPSADFCSAIRPPRGALSRRSDTEQISWGKLSRLPRTVAESTLRTLDGCGLRDTLPARPALAPCIFGFCPSTRAFARCFLQTPPRGDSPYTLLALHLHQVGQRTFTSKLLNMPSTPLNRCAIGLAAEAVPFFCKEGPREKNNRKCRAHAAKFPGCDDYLANRF